VGFHPDVAADAPSPEHPAHHDRIVGGVELPWRWGSGGSQDGVGDGELVDLEYGPGALFYRGDPE
jgi:hypothetical protein